MPKVDKVCKSVIEETTEERCKVYILMILFEKIHDTIILVLKYLNVVIQIQILKTVMRKEFDEECEDEEGKEECRTEFDYVCEEAKPKPTYAPPSSGYGIPQAPPISTYAPSTYGGGLKREIPKDDLPQYRYSLLRFLQYFL